MSRVSFVACPGSQKTNRKPSLADFSRQLSMEILGKFDLISTQIEKSQNYLKTDYFVFYFNLNSSFDFCNILRKYFVRALNRLIVAQPSTTGDLDLRLGGSGQETLLWAI